MSVEVEHADVRVRARQRGDRADRDGVLAAQQPHQPVGSGQARHHLFDDLDHRLRPADVGDDLGHGVDPDLRDVPVELYVVVLELSRRRDDRGGGLTNVRVWRMDRGVEFSSPRAAFGGMVRERVGLIASGGPSDG